MLSFNMTYKWTLGAACSSMTNDWQWNSQHGAPLSTEQNWGRGEAFGWIDIQQFADSWNSFQFHDKRKRSGLVVIAWKNLTQ